MDIASLFVRALDNKGDAYFPYAFEGRFTDDEERVIENAIKPYVPERVDAMFNNWLFTKAEKDFFMAKRATWEMVWCASSAAELAAKVTEYYSR